MKRQQWQGCLGAAMTMLLLWSAAAPAPARGRKQQKEPVYELMRFEGDHLRAVGIGQSYMEGVALENAENAAAEALARRVETAITEVRDRHTTNAVTDGSVRTRETTDRRVKAFVSQHVSYVVIGTPSVYRNKDRTYKVYVCVQLAADLDSLLGQAYETLTADGWLPASLDRSRFLDEGRAEMRKRGNIH